MRHLFIPCVVILLGGCSVHQPSVSAPVQSQAPPPSRGDVWYAPIPTEALAPTWKPRPANFHYTLEPVVSRSGRPILSHNVYATDLPAAGVVYINRGSTPKQAYVWSGGRLFRASEATRPPSGIVLAANSRGGYLVRSGAALQLVSGGTGQTVGAAYPGGCLNDFNDIALTQHIGRDRKGGDIPSPISHAFLLSKGKPTDLGALGSPDNDSRALAINNRRQVAGESFCHAFLWENGRMNDIGAPQGYQSAQPTALSERGHIAGVCTIQRVTGGFGGWEADGAFLWDGRMRALPNPAGLRGLGVAGLDEADTVIGFAKQSSEYTVPLVWRNGDVYDLNWLLPKFSGWEIVRPVAIDAQGAILALAHDRGSDPFHNMTYGHTPQLVLLTPAKGAPGTATDPVTFASGSGWQPEHGDARLSPLPTKPSPPATVVYDVTEPHPGLIVDSAGLDDHGRIAGVRSEDRTFLIENGRLTDLTEQTPDAFGFMEFTNRGEIVFQTRKGIAVWAKGKMRLIPSAGFDGAVMNDVGDTVIFKPPTLIHNGKILDLAALRSTADGWASGINDQRDVVGACGKRALLWRNGKATDLGLLHHTQSARANTINNRGQIVGSCFRSCDIGYALWQDAYELPFVWEHGRMTALPTLPGCNRTGAYRINDRGEIVGGSGHVVPGNVTIIWLNRHPYDLNSLLAPGTPWHIYGVMDINNRGEMVAKGQSAEESGVKGIEEHLLLLKPRPR